LIALIGISIAERLRDRGFDSCICFDDLSKHSKCYRQISLILAKIPSRDAFPADIFNIHSSLLERCGKLMYSYFGGSITAFPVIETINSDITEYIATNVISITDGQFYTNKRLFLDSCRPAIDSGLSVSRIGSSAQSKFMKVLSVGIKNLLTNYRIMELSSNKLLSLNISFYQDHLLISPIEMSLIILLVFRNGYLFKSLFQIYRLVFMLSLDFLYFYYILFISKHHYSVWIWCLIEG
jgi:F-type H+-transporting ATPase subunit alpha